MAFQTSTSNSPTSITVLPNGTSLVSQVNLYSDSSASNSSVFTIVNSGSEVSLRGNIIGTGSYLPMTFYTGGSGVGLRGGRYRG